MRRFIGCLLLSFAGISACQNAEEKKEASSPEATAPKEQPRSNFSEEGTGKLMNLLGEYYALKDALVASDAAKTTEQAIKLQMSADSMQRFISDSTHILYVQVKAIKTTAGEIVLSKADIEKQRLPFGKLSEAVFTLVKEANLKNAGIYRQYCPMAFNDKGAYWLSPEEKIRNPYFGKKMLTCGEVTDSLK